jgi:hypothetical protein
MDVACQNKKVYMRAFFIIWQRDSTIDNFFFQLRSQLKMAW